MEKRFYPGDTINYGFFSNLTIISEIDDKHYLIQDKNGNQKKISKSLINKYGEKVSERRLNNE